MHGPLSVMPLLALSVALGGCASGSDRYPSLAIRDVERVSGSFDVSESEDTAPAPTLSADDLASIPAMVEAARAAHARFLEAEPAARRNVAAAAGTGVTDNRWSTAQVALAGLESLRSQAAVPLADLDRLHAEAATTFVVSPELQEARSEVVALISQEDQVLGELRGRMPQ